MSGCQLDAQYKAAWDEMIGGGARSVDVAVEAEDDDDDDDEADEDDMVLGQAT